jgi:hypothetical protein
MNPSAEIDRALAPLLTEEDINQLVDSFCHKARHSSVFQADEPAREKQRRLMQQLFHFVLPGPSSPAPDLFPPDALISKTKDRLENWFTLFVQTLQEHFSGLILEIAEDRAATFFAEQDRFRTRVAC